MPLEESVMQVVSWLSLVFLLLTGCTLGENTDVSSRETAVEGASTTDEEGSSTNLDCDATEMWISVDWDQVDWASVDGINYYSSGMRVPTPWSVGSEKVSPCAGALSSFSDLSSALTWSNSCVGWNSSSFWIPSGSNGGCAHLEKMAE